MTPFDYGALDDIVEASTLGRDTMRDAIARHVPRSLGPLLEYAFIQPLHAARLPPVDTAFASGPASSLAETLATPGGHGPNRVGSLTSLRAEFSRIGSDATDADGYWTAFIKRLEHAALQAGFTNLCSKGLAGAFREMATNAVEHSLAPSSAIVGYRFEPNEFEYAVADAGVGVYESLRRSGHYPRIHDSVTALVSVLSGGHSRFGPATGRGTGFTTLLRSLTSLNGSLRFRSGDCAIEIDGRSPTLSCAQPRQRPHFQGFAVSITCRPK